MEMQDPSAPLPSAEAAIYHAELRQSGSLSTGVSRVIIYAAPAVALLASAGLLSLGLWPVALYLTLASCCVSLAFRLSQRRQKRVEHVLIDRSGVTISVGQASSVRVIGRFPLYGLTLERDIDPDFGLRAFRLSLRGRAVEVARDLAPSEKSLFADRLEAALTEANCPPWRRNRILPAQLPGAAAE